MVDRAQPAPERASLGSTVAVAVVRSYQQPVVWRASTIAGNSSLGNDGPATNAMLGRPRRSGYDRSGNLYVADIENNQIRRLGRDGRIVAVAGRGVQGSAGDGGPALEAHLNRPHAVAVDGTQLFIADSGNFRVRVVNLDTGIIRLMPVTAWRGSPGTAVRRGTPDSG